LGSVYLKGKIRDMPVKFCKCTVIEVLEAFRVACGEASGAGEVDEESLALLDYVAEVAHGFLEEHDGGGGDPSEAFAEAVTPYLASFLDEDQSFAAARAVLEIFTEAASVVAPGASDTANEGATALVAADGAGGAAPAPTEEATQLAPATAATIDAAPASAPYKPKWAATPLPPPAPAASAPAAAPAPALANAPYKPKWAATPLPPQAEAVAATATAAAAAPAAPVVLTGVGGGRGGEGDLCDTVFR